MKKIRHILLFIVAMAMMVSMFAVGSHAAESQTETEQPERVWKMGNEFAIGEVGSTAVLESGNFALGFHDNGYDANTVPYPLSTTVTDVGGVASLVSTNPDSPKRAFSKSATGIIDINAEVGSPIVYFKAPADGTYYYELEVTGAWTGTTVKYWAGMGVRDNDLRDTAFTNTEYVGLGNTAPLWNTSHHVYMNTVTVTKGQLIMFRPTNDGCNSANNAMTLNKFNVYRVDVGDNFTYDEEAPAKVNGNFTLGGSVPGTGAFDPLADAAREDVWAANAWYGSGENSGTRYFATAQGEGSLIDLAPVAWCGSEISYTATEGGVYSLIAQFDKRTASKIQIEVAINRVYGESFIKKELTSVTSFSIVDEDIELEQGDQITIRVSNIDGSPSNEVGVNLINVFYLGCDCHEWNNDGTCTTKATCKLCGEATGETNANNHTDTTEYVNNNNGTHTEQYKCCGAPVGEAVNHTLSATDGKCTANCGYECPHTNKTTANCQAASKCEACQMVFGEKDMTNHTSTETKFVSNDSATHTEKHVCCETPVGEAANHTLSATDGKCTANCGYTCPHADKTEATCEAASECKVCHVVFGEKNADNHTKGFIYVDNNDGTHTKKYECCNADAEAAKAHTVDPETGFCTANCGYECPHTNKTTATCLAASKCEACQMVFGDKDADNHTESTYPKNNGDGTHTLIYDCCEQPAGAAEAHDYGNDTICDVCYDGCDHDEFDENYTCTTCGYVCRHEAAEALRDCQTAPKCEVCDKQLEKDMTKHTSTETKFVDNEDGTHTEKNVCCESDIATNDHDWSNKDGKCAKCESECAHTTAPAANCVTAPICPVCEKQLEKDMTKHTSEATKFFDNEDGTHTEKHDCCGTVIATNDHDWTNKDGECVKCDATCAHANAPVADCKNESVCPTCGKTVADKDASKHVGTTVVVDNENGTHTEKYECCGTVVKADAKHTYTDGTCACGAKKPTSKPSSPQTSDTAMSVAVALVAIAGVGIFALNSKKRRQK